MNDVLETPIAKYARERMERIASARAALLSLRVPRIGGPDVKLLTRVLEFFLDELEAR